MRVLNSVGAWGNPVYKLSEDDIRILENEMGSTFDDEAKVTLQKIIDYYLDWSVFDWRKNAKPIFEFYKKALDLCEDLEKHLQAGPNTDDDQVRASADHFFRIANKSSDLNTLWKHSLGITELRNHVTRAQHYATKIGTREIHPRAPDDVLDGLILRLADFYESNGRKAKVYYVSAQENHRTPFVIFCDQLLNMIAAHLPAEMAETESIVRRVLKRRAENRQNGSRD